MSAVPEHIGDYQVIRELGRGAMGVVYLARHPALGRDMAIKVMAPELARDPEFLERFRREGAAAAKLRHPNIVGVFDFATRDGLSYIAMEYLGARTLKDLIEEGQQTPARACQMMDELLSALASAHDKGIVHRDIKPANVMVTDEGALALTDFSVAHMKEATKLTQTGAVVGTPEYMAPEQFDGKWDQRTDLYAAGIIFYELLTGFSPFRSATMTEVMRKQLLTVPDPPSAVDFTIPEALSAIVSKALEKDPDCRYQSAQEMRAAISGAPVAPVSSPATPASSGSEVRSSPPPLEPETLLGKPLHLEVAQPPAATAASSPLQPETDTPLSLHEPPNSGRTRQIVLGAVSLFALACIAMGLAKTPTSAAASSSPTASPSSPQDRPSTSPAAVASAAPDSTIPSHDWEPTVVGEPSDDLAPGLASSDLSFIVPGMSVGDVYLGQNKAEVEALRGAPARRQSKDGLEGWVYADGVTVNFSSGQDSVVSISVSNPEFRVDDEEGPHVGQSRQQIEELYGPPTGKDDKSLAYADEGIVFEFASGKCSYILIFESDADFSNL